MLSRRQWFAASAATGLTAGLRSPLAAAHPTDFYQKGDAPTDERLKPPKTLNDYFPFAVPKSLPEWEARKAALKTQLRVSLGLFPWPAKTPLNPVVHGRIERDGYSVEKVFFASMPGHYVCGNLYRPASGGRKPAVAETKHPAVLCPHGHWANGRFFQAKPADIARELKSGAEARKEGALAPLQAKCAALAKLGFVAFFYDMVGYADSTAISHDAAFRDAAAELRSQSAMGLQTWNSIRALDFIAALPDVDAAKIGVTGSSGGGTQTFMLCALDDRPVAAFPAVMVGTAMQGGCVCENCTLLRVGTGNVEIAAMFAPKPMAFSCADDWTKEFPTKGFPELQKLYAMYGKPGNVAAKSWPQYPHNYNQPAREFMYEWLSTHMLGKPGPVAEPPSAPLTPAEMSVFDAKHPRPADELPADKLRASMTAAFEGRNAAFTAAELRTAYTAIVGGGLPAEIAVRKGPVGSKHAGFEMHRAVLGRNGGVDAVPCAGVFGPKDKGETLVVWLHPQGKATLFDGDKLAAPVQMLVDAGFAVVAPDVFGVGELTPPKPQPVDAKFAGYTYGYNRPPAAHRVHDALTAVAFGTALLKVKKVMLVGWGEFGPLAVIAKALAGDAIAKVAADANRFRFDAITTTDHPLLLPGAVKFGGLPALVAACAPGPLLLHNHAGTGIGRAADAAYAGAKTSLVRHGEALPAAKVVAWLLA